MGSIVRPLNAALIHASLTLELNMACNAGMNDSTLIDRYGGAAKLAELLGFDKGGVQRVHNWRTRGIPPAVKLERLDLFGPDAVARLLAEVPEQAPAPVVPTAPADREPAERPTAAEPRREIVERSPERRERPDELGGRRQRGERREA
jgi:hypothetical protein